MLNILHTRLLAAALGCLAIAAARVSLADDQPAASPSNETQPATQSSPPTSLQLDAPTTTQEQPASPATQQPSQPDQPSSSLQPASDSQPSIGQTGSAQKSNASGALEWPARQRYSPNNPQGGSLGVNIVADGQGIIISRVHSNTPAQQMGLRPRDRVTSVNGQPVASADQFISIIRNMNAGDQVEIGIVRDEAPNTLRGKLEAFGQALARRSDPNSFNEQGIGRSGRLPEQLAFDNANPNVQAIYEERNQSGRQPSGDVEARLTSLEQQLSQLKQDVAELRTAIGNKPTSGSQKPVAGPAGNPSPRTPSVFRPTPGQPPSAR